jgi:hypothetical protein
MTARRFFLLLLIFGFPLTVHAGVSADDLPGDLVWYMHADLEEMRATESGSPLYDWFDDEVIVEINDEFGINLSTEVDSVTAFSDGADSTVIIVEGPLTKSSQDKLLAIATLEATVNRLESGGKEYYHVKDNEDDGNEDDDEDDDDDDDSRHRGNNSLDGFNDAAYFSFSVANKAIITSNESQMQELLKNGGKITGSQSHDGSMFVLTADRSFVQAGLRPDGMADDDDDWESNILRNTEQAAVLVSDSGGQIAVEAQLVSTDPKMAASIASIVNGLISLQAFNSDLDPELLSLIQNTKVKVKDNVLTVSTVIDPELVVSVLDD